MTRFTILLIQAFTLGTIGFAWADNAPSARQQEAAKRWADARAIGGDTDTREALLRRDRLRAEAIERRDRIEAAILAAETAQLASTASHAIAATLAPHVRAGTPLRIDYDGAERIIHPYRLGTNPRTGKHLLRAWEESKAGAPTRGFRTYAVSKIQSITPLTKRTTIDLPPAAWRPDKTIPNPIAQRNPPKDQTP